MKSRVRLLIVIKAMQSYTNLTVIFFIVIQAECMAMLQFLTEINKNGILLQCGQENLALEEAIFRRKKEGGCTFYPNTIQALHSPCYRESHIFTIFVPVLTIFEDVRTFCMLQSFHALRIMSKCNSRYLFSFGGQEASIFQSIRE